MRNTGSLSKSHFCWTDLKHLIPVLLLVVSILSGGTTGKLTGRVVDQATGEPLIGCNIIIVGQNQGAATDEKGQYFILNIMPGTYTVKAMMIGYATATVQDVQISVDLTTTLDFSLAVEVLGGEEITVMAQRPTVKMDLTSSEARISSDQIDVMPVNEIWDVISIQSGITKDAGGGIHIRGGRSREVAYWVDGVSVTDGYDGGLAIAVDNNAIQELQVISGTFNAEFGQAMSGIINMITKDGGEEYHGSVSHYIASYATRDEKLKGLKGWNFDNERNTEFNLSGPVPGLRKFITFYTNIRTNQTRGWLNAWKVFNKDGIITPRALAWVMGTNSQEPAIYPLSARKKLNTNTKLTFNLRPNLKLRLNLMTSNERYQDYRHEAQWSPEGELWRYNIGQNMKISLTHTISPRTFYNVDIAQFSKNYHHYAYSSETDSNYIDPYYFLHTQIVLPPSSFKIWGANMNRFERQTITKLGKFDFTSQINPLHQIKFGAEVRNYALTLVDYDIEDADLTDTLFTMKIPGKHIIQWDASSQSWVVMNFHDSSAIKTGFQTKSEAEDFSEFYNKYVEFGRNYYREKPKEFSAYIQDKIEFKSVIINIGLRYDWFNSNGRIPTNPAEPYLGNPRNPSVDSLSYLERQTIDWTPYADDYASLLPDSGASLIGAQGWWSSVKPKQQISPRLGIAYPITDKGVIHFSFGHFFQTPSFERLFKDPGYKIPEESGKFGVFGNPDLNPQKTVMYELGLQQEIAPGLSIDVTGYYRDVRDWVSTGIPINLGGGASYFTYVNKDYSNVRGVTLIMTRQFQDHYGFDLNYTFQIAEGSNSNPDEEFGAVKENKEPTRAIMPLEWDQTHTVNGALYLGARDWTISILGQFGSGYPYTPSINRATTMGINTSTVFLKNSRRKPITYNLDVNFIYYLPFSKINGQVYVKVFNLLDRRNELTVYSDTGRATYTYNITGVDEEGRPNPLGEYYSRPDWLSAPRQVQIGLKIAF